MPETKVGNNWEEALIVGPKEPVRFYHQHGLYLAALHLKNKPVCLWKGL